MSRPAILAISALYLSTIAAFADMYITQPLLPQLATEFGVTAAVAGLTISAVVLTIALTSAGYGALADVLGRRSVLVWGAALAAVATLACGFAPSFGWLIALRALQGALLPSISALAIAYIHDDIEGIDPAVVVGGYVASSIVGGLLGRVAGGLIAEGFGWRATFAFFAACTLLGAVVLALSLGRARRRTPRGGFVRDVTRSYGEMLRHLREPRLIGAFVMGAALFFGFIGFFTYLPFYLTAPPFRLSTATISWLFLPYIAGVIVSPFAGRLARRFSLRALMAVGIAVAMVGLTASLVPVLAVIVLGAIVLCAGMFLAQPLAPTFVARNARGHRGGATALYQSFYYLGAVCGSTLPGLAWQEWGWAGVIGSCLASLVLALLADWLLCAPQRSEPAPPPPSSRTTYCGAAAARGFRRPAT